MKFNFRSNFTFQNVGQGLFYTGRLDFSHCSPKRSEFNFVFDCGGEKDTINDSVKRYKDSIGGKKINLLIISHFHADHINGLNELLNIQR